MLKCLNQVIALLKTLSEWFMVHACIATPFLSEQSDGLSIILLSCPLRLSFVGDATSTGLQKRNFIHPGDLGNDKSDIPFPFPKFLLLPAHLLFQILTQFLEG